MAEKDNLHLKRDEIRNRVNKRIEKYKNLNFFEEFAMFLGTAQMLEFWLKKLLEEKFNYEYDTMEKWTLGKIANELEENDLRKDFIVLLKNVVKHRNYIAHELIANLGLIQVNFKDIIPEKHYSKDHRLLHKAILGIEELVFLFDWTNENDAWN